ncbi:MAG: GntR family transcriptional regulator [Pseudomonadota bacterium]
MTVPSRQSWRTVRDRIHAAILSGQYRPGARLPRDADLAEALDCARSTVQRAMQDLAAAGLVDRRRRGGTRVRTDPVTRATFDIPILRHEVESTGARYGYQLIRRQTASPPRPVQAALDLPEPVPMLHVEALHLADARPYMFEDRWISLQAAPGITRIDLARHSANEWLVRNIRYTHGEMMFFASAADARVAGFLDTAPGTALFVQDRTTWAGTRPITTLRATAAPGYRLRAPI